MNINYNSLQYFRVLAQLEHYTRAADTLHITQPALSKSIAALESEFGMALFEKDGRNIRLTSHGKILYDHIERGMHEFETGFSKLHGMNSAISGEINLAFPTYTGNTTIPRMISGFTQKYPGVVIKIYQNSSKKIVEFLQNGRSDLGICGDFSGMKEYHTDDLVQIPLFTNEFSFIVPADSPLANAKELSLQDVDGQVFIGYNEDVVSANSVITMMTSQGFHPKSTCFVSDGFLLFALVGAGLGIGVVPDSDFRLSGVVRIKVKNPYLLQTYFLAWNKKRFLPAAAESFKRYTLSREWETV